MSTLVTLPGLIDCHVHFREPGYEQKGTMATEAAAAVAGGVTTVCEMPNTSPPTVTVAALADKVRRASLVQGCDIRFFFGITEVIHLAALRELWDSPSQELRRLKARCPGAKIFLDHSTGNQRVDADLLDDIFQACAEHRIPLVAHCEDPEVNAAAAAAYKGPKDASAHSLLRPPESEAAAIAHAIDLARRHGTQLHIAHLSTSQGLELVRGAKAEGLSVTCEVTPHHLFLTTDDYASLGALAKMNPPLRSHEHQAALWAGIADRTIDCIATDHAPHTLEEKHVADPLKAPGGVPGVETMLLLLLTVAAGKWPHPHTAYRIPHITYQDIARLCCENPNRIFSLGKNKEESQVLVDPSLEWTIEGKKLRSKCGWTPYEGWQVVGKAVRALPRST